MVFNAPNPVWCIDFYVIILVQNQCRKMSAHRWIWIIWILMMNKSQCIRLSLVHRNLANSRKKIQGASISKTEPPRVHRFQRLNHPGCIDFWDWTTPCASIFGIEPPRVHRFLGFNYPGCIDFLVLRLRIEPPQVHPIVYLFWGLMFPGIRITQWCLAVAFAKAPGPTGLLSNSRVWKGTKEWIIKPTWYKQHFPWTVQVQTAYYITLKQVSGITQR